MLEKNMSTTTTTWSSKIYPLEPTETVLMREERIHLLLRFPRSPDMSGFMFTLKQHIEGNFFFKYGKRYTVIKIKFLSLNLQILR